MKRLIVDCCIRGVHSATRRYYQAYLSSIPEGENQLLELASLQLAPLDAEALEERDRLCRAEAFDHDKFRLARQFQEAEEILIAAPYWDLSFPALLKVYLEQVCVSGLTFGYQEDGRCVGFCRAERLLYFSTCGGYTGEANLGWEYVKALAAMLGIRECIPYIIEGMDIAPNQRERLLAKAICRLPNIGTATGKHGKEL